MKNYFFNLRSMAFAISLMTVDYKTLFHNLFNVLKSDVTNAFILKQKIKANEPWDSQKIEELFNAYGY